MPAEQEIVHWYNRVPDLANGEIPDDYPVTPDDYPANRIAELHDLLNRLCDEIGNITYDISSGTVNIVARGLPNGATFTFSLYQWLTNEREVKRYLRGWFPSFNIPYVMEGLANNTNIPSVEREQMLYELRKRVNMKVTPSPCTGKEEASDINYLDVI